MKSRMLRAASALIVVIALCILMNAAAPLIDTPTMRENAAQGVSMLHDEYPLPEIVGGFKSARLDNYTSVLMIKTAAYTGGESWLHKAFGGLRTDMPTGEGQTDWQAYCTYADGSLSPTQGLSYTRYWHGYTLPLRLLLCVFNLSNIQMLLYFLQTALMTLIVVMMIKRRLGAAVPAFFTAYFLMMPFALGVCLQFSTASLPMLLACAALLQFDDRISSAIGMPAFFAIVGIVTNYFDLLTFPLVTLGFPLVLLIMLRLQSKDGVARLLMTLIACCAAWGIGFGGMWLLKWVIAAACFGWERLYSIFAQVFLRVSTESNGVSFSRAHALDTNFSVIFSKSSYLALLGITGLASLLPAAKALLQKKHPAVDGRAWILLLIAAMPVAWFIVMANHSVDHMYYTYRILSVSVFAGVGMFACLLKTRED